MRKWILLAGLASVGTAHAGAGITSELYLTAGDQQIIWVVQGTSVNRSWGMVSGNREYPIAVGPEVRTLGGLSPEQGAEYSHTGVDSGTRYGFPAGISSAWDATTDLSNNYVVDFGTGDVYSMGRDWSNPTQMFNVSGAGGSFLGITYDFSDNTMWVSGWTSGVVAHYSMTGTFLGSFNTPFNSISCLALDHATGTLWMGSQNQQGTFFQYSKAGAAMGSVFIEQLVPQNTLGGEFQAVPEPSTIVGLALGVFALLASRKR